MFLINPFKVSEGFDPATISAVWYTPLFSGGFITLDAIDTTLVNSYINKVTPGTYNSQGPTSGASRASYNQRQINSLPAFEMAGAQNIRIGDSVRGWFGGDCSFAVVIQSDQTAVQKNIMGGAIGGSGTMNFRISSTTLSYANGAGTSNSLAITPDTGVHFVAFVQHGTDTTIYYDGVSQTGGSFTPASQSNGVFVGRAGNTGSGSLVFDGLIGEVFGINRAWTPTEVADLRTKWVQPTWGTP